jgi:hypothetical protein
MTVFSTGPFESLLSLQRDLERALGAPTFGFEGPAAVFPPLNIFTDRDGVLSWPTEGERVTCWHRRSKRSAKLSASERDCECKPLFAMLPSPGATPI